MEWYGCYETETLSPVVILIKDELRQNAERANLKAFTWEESLL